MMVAVMVLLSVELKVAMTDKMSVVCLADLTVDMKVSYSADVMAVQWDYEKVEKKVV